ncbi:MAG: UvrD-helicase domain-containing protein [Candidatus Paceibacterota bacterium]|jgi:DNA helicase-2/ATP-dependent DNA helicase PcrA
MSSHLESLNPRQHEAATTLEGPLLIIAGAGAGKTKTIAHRILHLIKSGVAPHQILAITFTNKAAKEMRERVMGLIRGDSELNLPIAFSEQPFVSTFHALGVHIIRENSLKLGLTRNFTIFDRNDSLRAVKEAVKSAGLDPKDYEPKKFLNAISWQKGEGRTLSDFEAESSKNYFSELVASVWANYEKVLKAEKSLDFDDLLLKAAKLLKTDAEVRGHYRDIWKYIHIDEYQDTNKVQYQIAKLLIGETNNICVVGDEDQLIYAWRGANISHILHFEKDFPNTKVVLLEQNYRSTKNILSVANQIISKNKIRTAKKLFTDKSDGDKIGLYASINETDEAQFVAHKALELIQSGASPREIAVLYRANFQSRVLEEAFLLHNIPYQVLGTRFFERKEVKDVLSFIRGALNPDSSADLKRIINVPPRGIGKVTLIKILAKQEATLPPATRAKVEDFREHLANIKEAVSLKVPSELVKFVLQEIGLEKELLNGTEEDHERLENLRELATLATRYDHLPLPTGTEKLLEDAALATDQDELVKDEKAVKLMTVHASKGLEFDSVFITGLEDNLFPHRQIGEARISAGEEEEERRLFYVAVTRARKKLFLSYSSSRTIFGSSQMNAPSEFITDIDDIFLEAEERNWDLPAEKIIYFD